MSEIEDAAATLVRLLKTNMRVVKDNGGLANIVATGEWQNTDAFKECDGQVTVGLAESADQKIELSGKKRRRLSALRVNVWTTEQSGAEESGRFMRGKIVEEVNRIVRQNSSKPNETRYDFYNLGPAAQTHKAYSRNEEAAPNGLGWNELSSEEYAALWTSDDSRAEVSSDGVGEYAVALFGFKIESREKTAKKITLTFEGYGISPSGDGIIVKVWNHMAGSWENAQSGESQGTDEPVTVTLVQDLPSYIDEDGYTWFLARTSGSSDGDDAAVLKCDYVSCTVTVNGVTYCDIVNYRNADRVDVKPFIFHTEFTVKSWFFEYIIGV
jgi:hypothetical protein